MKLNENLHCFTKKDLVKILDATLEKSLGEVDKKRVFDRTIIYPKITGIAGDVIEQSVLGYPADTRQEPDLIVDGEEVELKTTGLRLSKKNKGQYEAKEPMSITAVSPKSIITQEFESSHFWKKLEKLLLVYYLYDSDVTVPAAKYADFPIKGYDFHEFDEADKERLKNDWSLVKDYIVELQSKEVPEDYYSTISSKLRPQLMLIDTAPKWPNPPRFRLKRSTVTTIVQKYFGKRFEDLDKEFGTFSELDKQLKEFTQNYQGMTVLELMEYFKIPIKLTEKADVSKSVTEQIVVRMFGASSKKMKQIELFSEIGLRAKTITQTSEGNRTEDTKMFPVDFDEWMQVDKPFEESTMYAEFSEQQFLFIIFEESSSTDKLLEKRFRGFKRLTFDEQFIEQEVRPIWETVRHLIFDNKLVETIQKNKNGEVRINKNGTVMTSINFPKSADNIVFFRGSGANSADKPIKINGISMYRQDVWIKGTTLVEMLNKLPFL
jgi:DNA mismatch repair protein MutH